MKHFTHLIQQLLVSFNEEVSIKMLVNYWNSCADEEDKTHALKLLLLSSPKKIVTTRQLKEWAPQITKLPGWLIERSEEETGHFLQAFSLLLRSDTTFTNISLGEWIKRISMTDKNSDNEIFSIIEEITQIPPQERLLLLKIITGSFRSPVASSTIIRSIADYLEISPHQASLRIHKIGLDNLNDIETLKNPVRSEEYLIPDSFPEIINSKEDLSELAGSISDWNVFGEKEGIQVQIAKFQDDAILWSQQGEILNDKFPEIIKGGLVLPNTIKIHGQIIPKSPSESIETIFSRLQKKSVSKKERQDHPANFEIWTSNVNKHKVGELSKNTGFTVIENIEIEHWEQLDQIHKKCRKLGYTGILIQKKNKTDTYFYKKASCFAINAILTYVELDNLNKSGLKSLSFGVLDKNQGIVPIAKSDRIDQQIDITEIINFTKQNTQERFGPVRTVKPVLLFELHFDSIVESRRRKSGLALSNVSVFKKMNPSKATVDTLAHLQKLLE